MPVVLSPASLPYVMVDPVSMSITAQADALSSACCETSESSVAGADEAELREQPARHARRS